MNIHLTAIDHVVLTVRDMQATIKFYCEVLGMAHVVFDAHYNALHFGNQKINLHPFRAEYLPHADLPLPGTGDFCFVAAGNIESVVAHLKDCGQVIEVGPVPQTGARGSMTSIYLRDPDRNLIEIACYNATT
jgi:catechol 2,3-dioxygenase-like lactoylglutathione lyase family enzyme